MADNVPITSGSGTSIAADDIASVFFQRVKIALGADGAHDTDLDSGQQTMANSVPVAIASNQTAIPVTDNSGALTVDNAGTFAVQVDGSALTALQLIDNVVHVDDAAFTLGTHSGVMAMGFAGTQSVDANDACALACTTAGALHVSDAGGSLTVDNGGTFVVQIDGTALTRLTDIETNTDSGAVVGNGAAATAQRVTLANDSTGIVALTTSTASIGKLAANSGVDIGDVDVTSLPNVTLAAGTNTNEVVGDAAHGAAVAGNPLLTGLEGRSTAPTAVDDGDVVRALATTLGKLVVYPFALPANSWSYASPAAVTDTADDEAKAAVASTRHYITGVQVFNGHDSTGTEVVIKDGSTVLWRGWAEQTGGGCSAAFNPPLRGTANTAVNVANITNSSSTYFNLQGFSSSE